MANLVGSLVVGDCIEDRESYGHQAILDVEHCTVDQVSSDLQEMRDVGLGSF